MPVAPAGGVGELGGALLDEQLPLSPGVVLLREYPLELAKQLVLFARHTLPALLQPVHRIALQPGHDRLQAAEVLEDAQFLGDVDPRFEDAGALLRLERRVGQYRRDDAQRDRVELIDGRQHRGGVVAPRTILARPDSAEALVRDQLLEHLRIHTR